MTSPLPDPPSPPPPDPSWSAMAPAPRRSPLPLIAAALGVLGLLVVVVGVSYQVGQSSASRSDTLGTATSPTCDVIGINGCTTKGANGGGPAVAPPSPASPPAPSTSPPPPAPPAPPPPPTIEEGTWTVGADIPPGTYRTTGTAGDSCYWSITKSGSNGENIISNHVGGGRLTVVLRNGQDFETARCGTWARIG